MADWGAFIKSDDGSLLVTPDTRCYEFAGEYWPVARSGNVNTYDVGLSEYPLIFVNVGVGGAAGILAVETGPAGWRISVLATTSCPILVFQRIGGSASGYGMAVYGANGQLVFDSSRNVLNVRNASNLSEGVSFGAASGVDTVSYTCGPVWPSQSQAERWEFIEFYAMPDHEYVCTLQQVCEPIYRCNQVYQCTPTSTYVCGFDFFGNYSCSFQTVNSCGYVTQCDYVTECRLDYVCTWVAITTYYSVYARIRRTNWEIRRGTAQINAGSVSFAWLLHKSGFYDEVLYITTATDSMPVGPGFVPPGYIPPPGWQPTKEQVQGELNKTNVYPYTTSRANQIGLTCLTAVRSDYA